MHARSLAVAIAVATLLLAGCQTAKPPFGVLAPALRDQTHRPCADNCEVSVDPNKQEWAPENLDVVRGNNLFFNLPEAWEFDEPPIKLKPDAPPYLDCPEKAKRRIKCTLGAGATADVKIGYTIRVKVRPTLDPSEYDPFVWPKN